MVGLAPVRHPDQPPVGPIAPAVIGTGEDGSVALVVAAYFHAAVAARVQEDVDLTGSVAAQDYRFLTHRRDEVVARCPHLAFVPDEQPDTGEEPLQLLLIDPFVDEDLAADLPARKIDEAGPVAGGAGRGHAYPPENTP